MHSLERFETIKVAGRGAFGTVVVANDKFTKRRVAIKRIIVTSAPKIQLVREISALRCLNHQNVLKYIECFAQGEILSIVTEFVPFTLHDVISDKKRPRTEQLTRWFYSQVLAGIAHIHSKDIMHRDIKPENILVTASNIIKIADFGQACIYRKDSPNEEYDINVATRWYRAPELLFGHRQYGPAVDVWSIGCILAELFRGKPIFPGRSELEQISVIFGILGTPNEETWPNWRKMPDANKLLFEPREPNQNWTQILRLNEVPPALLNFIRLHLQLCSDYRPAASVLQKHSWLVQDSTPSTIAYRIPRAIKKSRESLPPIHAFF
ncbi:unnamed protein product [Caenorhabditis bovis]|uniref:Protein kinase domain-containing protein n=1 Tax=Caenorhabditis bovis TaxID=2654633 RepID=A0A8S1F1R9_9PELO|nr:unnamed protein product [Caenorhabditis bovis]